MNSPTSPESTCHRDKKSYLQWRYASSGVCSRLSIPMPARRLQLHPSPSLAVDGQSTPPPATSTDSPLLLLSARRRAAASHRPSPPPPRPPPPPPSSPTPPAR